MGWIELVGWVAVAANIGAYFATEPRRALRLLGASELIWLLFHALMGWPSAVVVSALTVLRNLLGGFAPDRVMRPLVLLILLGVAGMLWWNATAWHHYLPLAAAAVETGGVIWRDRPSRFRAGLIGSEALWAGFAIVERSGPNLVCAIIAIGVLLRRAIRSRWTAPLTPGTADPDAQ
jgi:hypothetical protein